MDENVVARHNNSGNLNKNHSAKNKKHGLSVFKAVLIVVVISALTVVGLLVYKANVNSHINNSKYQAVFLTNGQVYFGKLKKINGEYFELKDVFYLQTKTEDAKDVQKASSSYDGADIELIKLGSEIHGPDDVMIIDKSQVLFFENLKSDGTVSSSINKYYDQNK